MLTKSTSTGNEEAPVKVAVVGAGDYGTGLVSQMQNIDDLQATIICDSELENAKKSLQKAGVPDKRIETLEEESRIKKGKSRNFHYICDDVEVIPGLPVDVVVDCTGSIEAGAKLAYESILKGKHVVEVNVEMDVVVGPILNRLAQRAGVVYTLAYGDQPSLIAKLVNWSREIGFKVIVAGKGTHLYEEELAKKIIESKPKIKDTTVAYYDGTKSQIELASVANMTGLKLDTLGMHKPRVTIEEAVEIFGPKSQGGILEERGVVDFVNCLARDGEEAIEPRLENGVFVIVQPENKHSLEVMADKGVPVNENTERALLHRPYHLVGIETPYSILKAAIHEEPTGAPLEEPVVEVIAVAKTDIPVGTELQGIGSKHIKGIAYPAERAQDERLLPIGLANGVILQEAVGKGEPIDKGKIKRKEDSFAWNLRSIQDKSSNRN